MGGLKGSGRLIKLSKASGFEDHGPGFRVSDLGLNAWKHGHRNSNLPSKVVTQASRTPLGEIFRLHPPSRQDNVRIGYAAKLGDCQNLRFLVRIPLNPKPPIVCCAIRAAQEWPYL